MKIAIISLGCPKNQVDADVFCHALIKDGHTTTPELSEADCIIINTCGFIESAKAEAIENILTACQYKQANPNLKVVVTGCLAERYKEQIVEEIPEVDAVVGLGSNKALPAIIARLSGNAPEHIECYGPKTDMPLGGARVISTPGHYAYLKIAEGCNNRCHYCAIPLIRGPLRSRPIDDCVAEARWLASEGVKELILVAQDPTAYGEDWGKPGAVCELLDKLQTIAGLKWIRVLYAYPERISDEFIAAMVRNTKVCLLYTSHPVHIDRLSSGFAKKIETVCTEREASRLALEMVRKYCLLVRNFSLKGHSAVIQKIVNHIDLNLAHDLSLKRLSEEYCVNASYLSTLFKKEMGQSITAYIAEQRIKQAILYLNSTDMQIQEIALAVGITDLNYFSKLFKKMTGMPPSVYKKNL